MSQHGKKMLAPILITIIFLLYLFAYVALIVMAAADTPLVILFGIPVLLLGIGMVYVLYTRIREIRSGEEDDLDNY
jgi:fatty acid desaturase